MAYKIVKLENKKKWKSASQNQNLPRWKKE